MNKLYTLFFCLIALNLNAAERKNTHPDIIKNVHFVIATVTQLQEDGNYWSVGTFRFPAIKYEHKYKGSKKRFWIRAGKEKPKKIEG